MLQGKKMVVAGDHKIRLRVIAASKVFRNPLGIENKYFSTTAEGSASYGKQAFGKFGDTSPYTIIQTSAPTRLIPEIIPVDGGIPAVTISTQNLSLLGTPKILSYTSIP